MLITVTLYSTGCPLCKALEGRLEKAGILYNKITNVGEMNALGITHVPMLLSDDGELLDYAQALNYVNKRTPNEWKGWKKESEAQGVPGNARRERSAIQHYEQTYSKHLDFIQKYESAINASSGSEVDANANVEMKNITTMAGEVPKKIMIGTNRLLMIRKLTELYGEEMAARYIDDLEHHRIYKHDETSLNPYCVSVSLYPFLLNGLTGLGGTSVAPKHLSSFCGEFINLVFAVSAQFAGAVSTPEFLTYMDYFLRKDYGDDYYLHPEKCLDNGNRLPYTIDTVITDSFQQVVHSLNQPAAARNFQSVFWNIAYFDKPYFDGIFDGFVFPDGTRPNWNSVSWLQYRFMSWFNKERTRQMLTFPVETLNLLNDGEKCVDEKWADKAAEMYARGHSFFTYTSDSVDSLASCCRLRNGIVKNAFSFTLGAGGVSTGSKGVITINVNRLVQDSAKQGVELSEAVRTMVDSVHKYLIAYNAIVRDWLRNKLLPVYDAGFISMERQYLTIGINGFIEGAEFLGIEPDFNPNYLKYGESILRPIYEMNQADKTDEIMFNTEFVPAENLGVKNAKWDKEDGYFSPRECYNSYFYPVEDESVNIIEKFRLHGRELTKWLDGGSALHCNLEEHLSKEQYKKLMNVAIATGCSYFTYNIPNTICNNCGYIDKRKLTRCPSCGSEDLDYATRIIGYLKRVSRWPEARQREEEARYYADGRTEIR